MIDTQSGRLIGYARVSTSEQELDLQVDSLLAHGVEKQLLFCDKISGAREDRPGLAACNESLQSGDTLVVWRLDRLGRSMRHLVNMIEDLKERGIGFRSISDGMIDTTSASGELVLNIFSALAQFERRLIQERTPGSPLHEHAAAAVGDPQRTETIRKSFWLTSCSAISRSASTTSAVLSRSREPRSIGTPRCVATEALARDCG